MARNLDGLKLGHGWNKGIKKSTNSGRTWFKKGLIPHNKKDKINMKCIRCNKNMEVQPCFLKRKFCCRFCFSQYRKENNLLKGNNHPNWEKSNTWCKGENNYNWKGGISKHNKNRWKDTQYIHWRKECMQKDNWTCSLCEKRGVELNVHHQKSWSDYPELRLNINNGITLCKACHKFIHMLPKIIYILNLMK